MSWTLWLSSRNTRLISLMVNAIKPMSSGGGSSPVVGSTGGGAVVLACAAVIAQTASAAMVSTMWRASAV